MHNSQILWESANFLFTFHDLGTVQNLAESALRGEYTLCLLRHFLLASPVLPCLQRPAHPSSAAPSLPAPFEQL